MTTLDELKTNADQFFREVEQDPTLGIGLGVVAAIGGGALVLCKAAVHAVTNK